jgi:hypothetical protein
MKSESPSPRKAGTGRKNTSVGIAHLPMEWMDPMSWRLPSGKALAEFALQAGFLAPLIMRAPKVKKRAPVDPAADLSALSARVARERIEEAPERTASFRETR